MYDLAVILEKRTDYYVLQYMILQ